MPPNSTENCGPLSADALGAVFGQATAPGACALAVVDANGAVVSATAAALEAFGAKSRAELQRLLLAGDGPTARRLRHLAATMTVGAAPRLERLMVVAGRRTSSINLHCARVAAADGLAFLALWMAGSRGQRHPAPVAPRPDPPASPAKTGASFKLRFLWGLDRDGRFDAPDPSLIALLGAEAPRLGEALADLRQRVEIENADGLARAIETRETFSNLLVCWRRVNEGGELQIALSAAPAFDAYRDFAGYRGFGIVVGPIDAVSSLDREGLPATEQRIRAAESVADEAVTAQKLEDAVTESYDALEAGDWELAIDKAPPSKVGALSTPAPPPDGESVASQPDTAQSEPAGAATRHERTAEIYVLHQTHVAAPPSKVVSIRLGSHDPTRSHGSAPGFDESVELTKSERDAFREIARALVGRTPSRQDWATDGSNPIADAHERLDEAFGRAPSAPPLSEGPQSPPADGLNETAERNALGILDRLPIGVVVARDARALYLNHTLLGLLGYRDFAHFASSDGLATMFRAHNPEAASVTGQGALSIAKADGQLVAVEGHAQAIVWEGAPATLIALRPWPGVAGEGSRREDREKPAPIGQAAELQNMLDHAVDGAVTLDAAGRIMSFNRPAERLFGYDQEHVTGESVLMLLAPQSHPETTASLERLSRSGEAPEAGPPLDVVGRERRGASLTLQLTLIRIGLPEAPHYCALFRDMRRVREEERRLAAARDAALAASAAKTDFLAQVSHEIRTPLHAILGFAEVMMEERFGPIGNDRYRDYLKDIHASGNHVMSLADDLLDLSKIESGKLDLAFAPVDANSLIRECVSLMQPQAARERIIMRLSLFDRLPRVMVDERSLKQIMLNLMSNAVKFNEPGGQVIVSTAVDAAGQAIIRVRDTGMGMSESEVGRALEPFGQIGRAGRKGGVGLGLPLTKALVEANGAEFSIKSRREHGTLIEIAFPIVQAAQ